FGYRCPVLLDPRHQLVAATGVTTTPEVAVVTADGRIAYRGRIDDRYPQIGVHRQGPTPRDLRPAPAGRLGPRRRAGPRATAAGGCRRRGRPRSVALSPSFRDWQGRRGSPCGRVPGGGARMPGLFLVPTAPTTCVASSGRKRRGTTKSSCHHTINSTADRVDF